MLSKRGSATIMRSLFSRKSKNKRGKNWKSEISGLGQKGKKRATVKEKLTSTLPFSLEGARRKSYLSRAEKRKKYTVRALRITAAVLMVSISVILLQEPLCKFLSSLDFFMVKEIQVSGCRLTKAVDIKEEAGAFYNTSIFSFSPKVAANKLETMPWVKSVDVKRLWPNGIAINIHENKAVAMMVTKRAAKDILLYIDNRGKEIALVRPGDDVDFPVITGLWQHSEEKKEVLLKDTVKFIRLIANNDPNLPAQSVSEIHLDGVEGIVIYLVDYPFPIYFGSGEVKKKYKQLRNVLAVLYKKRKKKVDISNIEYIRMNYNSNKVLVAQSDPG